MKKELAYFNIETSFGGNQDWFTDHWMNIGGCAAAAACDSCICMEKSGLQQNVYPYDIKNLNKKDYIDFAMQMKPYLRPRWNGIDKLEIYIDGMNNYLRDIGNSSLLLESFSDDRQLNETMIKVKQQIDNNLPIPFLLLRHQNRDFYDLLWHWFMLVGYDEFDGELYVKIATYGDYSYFSFGDLWSSGHKNNGGMILYSCE